MVLIFIIMSVNMQFVVASVVRIRVMSSRPENDLEVIFDPVVDLPDQGLLLLEGCDEFLFSVPAVSDISEG